MANKMTLADKELVLIGMEQLLIQFTTKCNGSYRNRGLCIEIDKIFIFSNYLYDNDIGYLLKKYIKKNKPYYYLINYILYGGYYWKPYNDYPRIKYLRRHIKKLKKELGYKG